MGRRSLKRHRTDPPGVAPTEDRATSLAPRLEALRWCTGRVRPVRAWLAVGVGAVLALVGLPSASMSAGASWLAYQRAGCNGLCAGGHGREQGNPDAELPSTSAVRSGWVIENVAGQGATGTLHGVLSGVSCPAPTVCVAVGSTEAPRTGFGPGSPGRAVVEQWNGKRWSPAAIGTISDSSLLAVSCSSPAACTAVGFDGHDDLTATWNGLSWAMHTTPGAGELYGVSCVSPNACVAVGSAGGTGNSPRAELWNGSVWTVEPTATLPPSDYLAGFSGVSCVAQTSCTAVGSIASRSSLTSRPLAEHWDGTTWKVQPIHTILGPLAALSAVSCVSTNDCMAVGWYGPPQSGTASASPLTSRWNGTVWRITQAPGSSFALRGVSCASASACTAVGGGDITGGSLQIEVWRGKHWSLQANPAAGTPSAALQSVSCTALISCTAVGDRIPLKGRNSGSELGFAEGAGAGRPAGVAVARPSAASAAKTIVDLRRSRSLRATESSRYTERSRRDAGLHLWGRPRPGAGWHHAVASAVPHPDQRGAHVSRNAPHIEMARA